VSDSVRCPNGRTGCAGHKHFRGGSMDGHVACLVYAQPSDYPSSFGTAKRDGQRSWYVRDLSVTGGSDTEAHYRFVGHGDRAPELH